MICKDNFNNKNLLDEYFKFKPVQLSFYRKSDMCQSVLHPSLEQPDSTDQWLMALMDERHLIRHEPLINQVRCCHFLPSDFRSVFPCSTFIVNNDVYWWFHVILQYNTTKFILQKRAGFLYINSKIYSTNLVHFQSKIRNEQSVNVTKVIYDKNNIFILLSSDSHFSAFYMATWLNSSFLLSLNIITL